MAQLSTYTLDEYLEARNTDIEEAVTAIAGGPLTDDPVKRQLRDDVRTVLTSLYDKATAQGQFLEYVAPTDPRDPRFSFIMVDDGLYTALTNG